MKIANTVATVLAWITVAVCALALLVSIAVGVFYVSALALLTGAVMTMVALWRPGSRPDRRVTLQPRG